MRGQPAVALAIALLFALHPSASASPTNSPKEWSAVSFEMRSWGRILSSWSIAANGEGNWTQSSGDGNKEKVVVHELSIGPAGFAQVAAILAKLPRPAPDYAACENFMTDQPYGVVRLTKGSTTTEIAWNAGCMDVSYLHFLDALRSANDMVKSWGEKGKIRSTAPAE